MSRAYNVIDADGHILEPLDLWEKYIDPKFRDRAPKIVKGEDGKDRLVIEEHEVGISRIGAVGARQGVIATDTTTYKDGKPGGFDPHKRIPDMDADGIDAAFLYPSLGLFSGAIHDPQLAAACRAYNRWLADYCSPYPDRLFGVAMLPMQDPHQAIEEMRFARRELGFKGGFLRPNPYHENHMMHHPMYEPFWAAAGDLDFSIGFHEGGSGSGGMPTVGVDRFEGHGARHIISHTSPLWRHRGGNRGELLRSGGLGVLRAGGRGDPGSEIARDGLLRSRAGCRTGWRQSRARLRQSAGHRGDAAGRGCS